MVAVHDARARPVEELRDFCMWMGVPGSADVSAHERAVRAGSMPTTKREVKQDWFRSGNFDFRGRHDVGPVDGRGGKATRSLPIRGDEGRPGIAVIVTLPTILTRAASTFRSSVTGRPSSSSDRFEREIALQCLT